MSKPAQQKTQAQTAPQDPRLQVGPTPAERIHAAQEEFVRTFIDKYNGRTSLNLDGKHFREWNPADFSRLTDSELSNIRAVFAQENYDLIDQIRPTSMNRTEFARSILREAARRGNIMDYYERRMPFGLTPGVDISGLSPEELSERRRVNVTVSRPQEAAPENRRTVTVDAAFITARDATVAILRNRLHASINVQPDVAAQTGIVPDAQGRLPGFDILTDAAVADLAYSMAAAPQNRKDGSTPLELVFDQGEEQIRYGYCAVANDIYAQRGRTIDQQLALSPMWLQAREDTRSNFDPSEVRIGVLGEVCPPNTPPVNDTIGKMLVIRGISNGRSAN